MFNLIAGIETFIIAPFVLVGLIVLAVFGLIIYRRWLRIPKPNEALIIVGKSKKSHPVGEEEINVKADEAIKEGRTEGLDFRIATAATLVNPITSRVFELPLNSRTTDFSVDCHDSEKIAVTVKGVILYKVGDNYPAMAAAARRFLDLDENGMNKSISNLVTGQVRALVGGITIPQLITDRQKLMEEVRNATGEDMAKLGLQIDSLTIQEITDQHGYIDNLAKPQAERVAQEASVAADQARQQKEEAKQVAELNIAQVQRDTEVKAAAFQAERDKAVQSASQAGPLAQAEAKRAVVAEETKVAELEIAMTQKRLDAEVRQVADAELYKASKEAEAAKVAAIAKAEAQAQQIKQVGSAEAEAVRLTGEAKAKAVESLGLAEAKATKEKAAALAENGHLVIDQKIAENLPDIAHEIAAPLAAVDNMMVLDGAEGTVKAVTGAVMAAGGAIGEIRDLVGGVPSQKTEKEPRVRPSVRKAELEAASDKKESTEDTSFNIPKFSGDASRIAEEEKARIDDAVIVDPESLESAKEHIQSEGSSAYELVDQDKDSLVSYIESELVGADTEDLYSAVKNNKKLREALVAAASDEQMTQEIADKLQLSGVNLRLFNKLIEQLR